MIRNIAQNKWQISREIISLVGKPFSFNEREIIRGIGIPEYEILEASESINHLLSDADLNRSCTLELRPSGVIIGLGSDSNKYSWAIPYYKLNAFGLGNELSLHADIDYIRLKNHYSIKQNNEFMKKLRELRNKYIARAIVEN